MPEARVARLAIPMHKPRNLAADKRKQDYRKQQLVKKMKEIAERKKNDLAVPLRGL